MELIRHDYWLAVQLPTQHRSPEAYTHIMSKCVWLSLHFPTYEVFYKTKPHVKDVKYPPCKATKIGMNGDTPVYLYTVI